VDVKSGVGWDQTIATGGSGPAAPAAAGVVSSGAAVVITPQPAEAGAAALSAPALAVPSPDLAPGTVVGEYRIEGKLGEGGMGQVFAAVHPLIGKRAAIKVIRLELCANVEAVERFVQEARAVNQIGHPNIVDIFAFGTLADGRSYFVMEHLSGESLGDRLTRGPLSLGEAATILDQIADALEAAHEKGIVHRDLKPDNAFLVTVRGNRQIVKLLDFGIAKLAGAPEQRVQRTRTGTMMGTPAYISPEQARGKNVDHRTDVYSLGCMGFEMFVGRLPFDADNPMDMIASHLSTPPPRASTVWPEIPRSLDDLLVAMMDKDPAKRPSLAVVRAHLHEFGGTMITGPEAFGASSRWQTPVPGPSAAMVSMTPPPSVTASSASAASVAPTEYQAPRPKKGRIFAIGGIVATVAIGVVVIAFVATRKGSGAEPADVPPAPTASPSPSPPAAAAATIPIPIPVASPIASPVETPVTGGRLALALNVDDATVVLDGKTVSASGRNPEIAVLTDGDHDLEVSAPGRKTKKQVVVVTGGATVKLEVALERAGRSGKSDAAKPTKPTRPTKPTKPAKPTRDTDYTIDPFKKTR
jgi:serine/threonine-protein kinase